VAYLLKAKIAEPEKQPLLGNGFANTSIAMQWFSIRATIENAPRERRRICLSNNRRFFF
jgi:hypothetical protein